VTTWANSGFNLYYIIGTISTNMTAVSWSAYVDLSGAGGYTHAALAIDGRKLLSVAQVSGGLKVQVGTIAVGGASITWTAAATVNALAGTYCSLTNANGVFVLAFVHSSALKLQTATLAGDIATWSAVQTVVAEAVSYTALGYNPTTAKVVLAYKAVAGMAVCRSASASDLATWSEAVSLNAVTSNLLYLSFDPVNKLHTLGFQNASGGSYGFYQTFTLTSTQSNYTEYVGIAQTGAAADAVVSVRINGIDSGQSGLVPNTKYYLQADGSISATVSSVLVGRAIMADKLLLNVAMGV
jgi:hypothetical protein